MNPFDNPEMFDDVPDPDIPLVEGIGKENGLVRNQDGDVFIAFEGVVSTYHELVHSDMFQMLAMVKGEQFVEGAHFLVMQMYDAWEAADAIAKQRNTEDQNAITADLENMLALPDADDPHA